MNEQDEWPYWKAAISCLPSQEMRDAAWEFFVRHLAQNPKMADTFSGVILVMQANGLYMLKVPKLVHDEALVPLGREVSRLRDEMAETVSRHAEVTRDSFAVCEKTRQVAEAAVTVAKELDDAIRGGWREGEYRKAGGADSGGTGKRRPASARRAMPPSGGDDSRPQKCRRPTGGVRTQTPLVSFQGHPCRDADRLPLSSWEDASLSVGGSSPATTTAWWTPP